MTDNMFLLSVLNDGRWHSNTEILQASFAERGCGLTVHSRASDLRKMGYVVETKGASSTDIVTGLRRRVCYYRLVGALNEAAAVPPTVSSVSLSASTPVVPLETPNREGALLALFDSPQRGAYGDDAA